MARFRYVDARCLAKEEEDRSLKIFDPSGFVYDWLVADLLPNEETLRHLNSDVGYFQKCDPKRPSTW